LGEYLPVFFGHLACSEKLITPELEVPEELRELLSSYVVPYYSMISERWPERLLGFGVFGNCERPEDAMQVDFLGSLVSKSGGKLYGTEAVMVMECKNYRDNVEAGTMSSILEKILQVETKGRGKPVVSFVFANSFANFRSDLSREVYILTKRSPISLGLTRYPELATHGPSGTPLPPPPPATSVVVLIPMKLFEAS